MVKVEVVKKLLPRKYINAAKETISPLLQLIVVHYQKNWQEANCLVMKKDHLQVQ